MRCGSRGGEQEGGQARSRGTGRRPPGWASVTRAVGSERGDGRVSTVIGSVLFPSDCRLGFEQQFCCSYHIKMYYFVLIILIKIYLKAEFQVTSVYPWEVTTHFNIESSMWKKVWPSESRPINVMTDGILMIIILFKSFICLLNTKILGP